MNEKHPFGNFVPKNSKYLLLGSFTGRQVLDDPNYHWFYATKRNQFWPIMSEVYPLDLTTKERKQKLFKDLQFAITDIILSCERKSGNNLDNNLINIVFNTEAIDKVLRENKINTIFFSSRFVEKLYKKNFKKQIEKYPKIQLITLPSPSPRYAAMSKAEKIKIYKKLLPKLHDTK